MSQPYDAIILGAGAAGCMAAIQAGRRGRRVLLVDSGKRVGGKIPISGGGRCNFTNRGAMAANFSSANPDFCRSALARFTPEDTEAWVASHNIAYHEKTLGQLFCDRSAMDIVTMLEAELREAGVEVKLLSPVEGAERKGSSFRVWGPGWEANASSLVIALGGLSYEALGATDLGYKLARQFGLSVLPTAPALDGFVFSETDQIRYMDLQGLALPAILTCGNKSFREAVLFTHKGLSGPAALQGSLYWQPGAPVTVDFWPGEDAAEAFLLYKREAPRALPREWLATRWPKALAERWGALYSPTGEPVNRLSDVQLRQFATHVQAWTFTPVSTVGYHKAEVTKGGVDTTQLSSKTMQALKVQGLYFIGEVVDVTGELGGYNFQWAWASGWACGQAI